MNALKNIISVTMVFALLLILPPISLYATNIRVIIDGQDLVLETPPQIIDGRTMVPMRAIFEALDAEVGWDGDRQTITAHIIYGCEVVLTIGSTVITINGSPAAPMDVPPSIVDERTLVPVRFVAQTLGHEVVWDSANAAVLINTDPFIRLDPRPVTLTHEPIEWRQLGSWIIYYQHTGGVSELEREVVRLVNIERAKVNAPPLEICPLLSASARFKSQEMADLGYFSHHSPVYGDFANIPRMFGAYHVQSENLSRRVQRADMAQSIVDGLMDSPGHRANKLNLEWNAIGVGVVMAMGAGVNFDGTPIADRYAALTTQMFGISPEFFDENSLMDIFRDAFTEALVVMPE